MSAKMGTCGTCEQWAQENPSYGYCRNRSPVVDPQAYIGLMGDKPLHGPKTLWPQTCVNDWCADYLPKIDQIAPS